MIQDIRRPNTGRNSGRKTVAVCPTAGVSASSICSVPINLSPLSLLPPPSKKGLNLAASEIVIGDRHQNNQCPDDDHGVSACCLRLWRRTTVMS